MPVLSPEDIRRNEFIAHYEATISGLQVKYNLAVEELEANARLAAKVPEAPKQKPVEYLNEYSD